MLALESVVDPVSLYEPVYSDGGDTIFVMDQVGDHSDDRDWLEEISLRDAIRNLGEREKKILTLRPHPDRGGKGNRHLAGAGLPSGKKRAGKNQGRDALSRFSSDSRPIFRNNPLVKRGLSFFTQHFT